MATKSSFPPGGGRAAKAGVRSGENWPDVDRLGMIAMFCGAGLLLAVLWVICGLDLSIGF